MALCRGGFGFVGVAFGAVLVAACRPPAAVPGRPDALRTGTFALTLRGTFPVWALGAAAGAPRSAAAVGYSR